MVRSVGLVAGRRLEPGGASIRCFFVRSSMDLSDDEGRVKRQHWTYF